MNKQQEALRLALKALEVLGWQPTEEAMDYRDNAIDAIRKALAEQPAQEPVCAHGVDKSKCGFCEQPAQPSKPWVGLTDEEMKACTQSPFVVESYRAIEAKLKERNT